MKTYYRDFLSPTRKGVPDNSRSRAIEFAEARSNLGHNVISRVLTNEEAVKLGYRIYFSAGVLRPTEAEQAIREETQ